MKAGSNAMLFGTRRGKLALVLGFVMANMLTSGTVLGQGAPQNAPDAEAATAGRHFEVGLEAVQADKWAAAREEFAAAYALSPQPKYLAALIKAEMVTGRNREAAQHLTMLLRQQDQLDPKTIAEAEAKLAELKAKLGVAKIQVNMDGAEVLVDGTAVGNSPLEGDIFVNPGQRTFEAKKERFESSPMVVDVKAGSESRVVLVLRKVGPRPVVLGNGGGPDKKVVYAGIGVTGGLALVGVGLGVVANNLLFSAADDRQHGVGCAGYSDCERKFNELHDTRIALNYVAIGAGIGAGVAGAATLIYALTAKKRDEGAVPRATVMVGPGGGALVLTGRF